MTTRGTLRTIALIAAATICFAGCVAAAEVVTDPEITCQATPDDLCLRIADLAMSDEADLDAIIEVRVKPVACTTIGRGPEAQRGPTAARCWRVEGYGVTNGFGRWVYEFPDSTLALEW